jgi:hypothetical protein
MGNGLYQALYQETALAVSQLIHIDRPLGAEVVARFAAICLGAVLMVRKQKTIRALIDRIKPKATSQ